MGDDPTTCALATHRSTVELRPHGSVAPSRTEIESVKGSRITIIRRPIKTWLPFEATIPEFRVQSAM